MRLPRRPRPASSTASASGRALRSTWRSSTATSGAPRSRRPRSWPRSSATGRCGGSTRSIRLRLLLARRLHHARSLPDRAGTRPVRDPPTLLPGALLSQRGRARPRHSGLVTRAVGTRAERRALLALPPARLPDPGDERLGRRLRARSRPSPRPNGRLLRGEGEGRAGARRPARDGHAREDEAAGEGRRGLARCSPRALGLRGPLRRRRPSATAGSSSSRTNVSRTPLPAADHQVGP